MRSFRALARIAFATSLAVSLFSPRPAVAVEPGIDIAVIVHPPVLGGDRDDSLLLRLPLLYLRDDRPDHGDHRDRRHGQ